MMAKLGRPNKVPEERFGLLYELVEDRPCATERNLQRS